jgi:NHL repeat
MGGGPDAAAAAVPLAGERAPKLRSSRAVPALIGLGMFDVRAQPLPDTASTRLTRDLAWPQLPASLRLDRIAAVVRDSTGRFYAAHRGETPLFSLEPDGRFRAPLGAGVHRKSKTPLMRKGQEREEMEELYFLHGLHVDPWDNVWITDIGRHLVMRFNPQGQLTLQLGVDGEPGCDERHFNQPTAVCVVPSGEFFVTDGYGNSRVGRGDDWVRNSRVVKFGADGRFIKAWGERGTEPGQFHTPHAIILGKDGNLYVSDRENDRIQVFDQDGNLQAVWSDYYSVDGLSRTSDGTIYGSAGMSNSVIEFDGRGGATRVWAEPGLMDYPHGLWVDDDGTTYISETGEGPLGDRLLKFRRTPK